MIKIELKILFNFSILILFYFFTIIRVSSSPTMEVGLLNQYSYVLIFNLFNFYKYFFIILLNKK
jgi:hypothetical protein